MAAPSTQGAESALFSGSGLLEAVPHGTAALRAAALAAHLLPAGDSDAEEEEQEAVEGVGGGEAVAPPPKILRKGANTLKAQALSSVRAGASKGQRIQEMHTILK